MNMLPQEQITETIHEAPPVSDWSLWGLRFSVQPAKQVKPRFPFCLLKKCWGKSIRRHFLFQAFKQFYKLLTRDTQWQLWYYQNKRILSSPPFFRHLLPALYHICNTTQVRSPDKLAHITNPSLTVTECDVFRFYLLFPLFPFPLCQNPT